MDDGILDLDARLTIAQLVLYFGGDVTYQAIEAWVRRGKIPHGKDWRGRVTIRLGDALEVEARTHRQRRGRPRKSAPLAA